MKNILETVFTIVISEKVMHGSNPCLCFSREEARKNPNTQTCSLHTVSSVHIADGKWLMECRVKCCWSTSSPQTKLKTLNMI